MTALLTGRDIDRLDSVSSASGTDSLVLERNGSAFKIDFSNFDQSADVYTYTAIASTYTIATSDQVVDCTSGTFTVTLPTAVGVTGKWYHVKNSGAGVITLEGGGSETIDDQANVSVGTKDNIFVLSNGSDWIVL